MSALKIGRVLNDGFDPSLFLESNLQLSPNMMVLKSSIRSTNHRDNEYLSAPVQRLQKYRDQNPGNNSTSKYSTSIHNVSSWIQNCFKTMFCYYINISTIITMQFTCSLTCWRWFKCMECILFNCEDACKNNICVIVPNKYFPFTGIWVVHIFLFCLVKFAQFRLDLI